MAASYGCRCASSGMRSPFGAPPRLSFRRPNATTQLRAALHSLADRYRGPYGGPWTLSTAKLSQTPGRPVIVPAGTMPEAAREQFAKPPAGAAPAPHSGLPSGKRPLRGRGDWSCNRNSDTCQYFGDDIFLPRDSGEGDHPKGGGRGVGRDASLSTTAKRRVRRPFHRARARSPSPVSTGEDDEAPSFRSTRIRPMNTSWC
jgi:hypothetical protein